MLSENLVGQMCRPNSRTTAEAVSNVEFIYVVVAAWLQPPASTVGLHSVYCAVVAPATGGTNILKFTDLEFDAIKTPGALYK